MSVASLSPSGGQDKNISSTFPHFPQMFFIFFLILVSRVGYLPTSEGPGYATAQLAKTLDTRIQMPPIWSSMADDAITWTVKEVQDLGGGHSMKRWYGYVGGQDPVFMFLQPFFRSPVAA